MDLPGSLSSVAPLADVRGEFLMLWGLTIFYGGIVWILEIRRRAGKRVSIAE